LQAELEQSFARYSQLLALFRSGNGCSSNRTDAGSDPSALSSTCNSADERTQSRAPCKTAAKILSFLPVFPSILS